MRKADNLPRSCAVVTKSGNFNFLEPSGPLQASNGTALPLPLLGSVQIMYGREISFLTGFLLQVCSVHIM